MYTHLSSTPILPRSVLVQRSLTLRPASRSQYSRNTSEIDGLDPVEIKGTKSCKACYIHVHVHVSTQRKFSRLANLVLQHTLDIPAVTENHLVDLASLAEARTHLNTGET